MRQLLLESIIRTVVEIIPFVAVIIIELYSSNFKSIYNKQYSSTRNTSDILPDLTDDQQRAVRQVARFSSVENTILSYWYYTMIIVSVIILSKLANIFTLELSTDMKLVYFLLAIVIWFLIIISIYKFHSSSDDFFDEKSPIKYYRSSEQKIYNRYITIPKITEIRIQRGRADILLINTIPILLIILLNIIFTLGQYFSNP